jgi:hypothetical protein
MPCKKEDTLYMCSCGTDSECIETITDIFGSMIVSDENRVGQLRSACSHFDKVVLGLCPDEKDSI